MISCRRRTEPARIDFSEVVADRAENDSLLNFSECIDQSLEIGFGRTHDVKREPLRRLVANARQSFQLVD
jgi:hypothetical protein